MMAGVEIMDKINCLDLCDILRVHLTTYHEPWNAHVMKDDSGIFLGVFVTSIFILPAVLLLWMWNKETPTLKREKNKGR